MSNCTDHRAVTTRPPASGTLQIRRRCASSAAAVRVQIVSIQQCGSVETATHRHPRAVQRLCPDVVQRLCRQLLVRAVCSLRHPPWSRTAHLPTCGGLAWVEHTASTSIPAPPPKRRGQSLVQRDAVGQRVPATECDFELACCGARAKHAAQNSACTSCSACISSQQSQITEERCTHRLLRPIARHKACRLGFVPPQNQQPSQWLLRPCARCRTVSSQRQQLPVFFSSFYYCLATTSCRLSGVH